MDPEGAPIFEVRQVDLPWFVGYEGPSSFDPLEHGVLVVRVADLLSALARANDRIEAGEVGVEVGECIAGARMMLMALTKVPHPTGMSAFAPLPGCLRILDSTIKAANNPSLASYGEIVEKLLETTTLALSCYRTISQLDEKLVPHVTGWFATHLPNRTSHEWLKLVGYLGPRFAQNLAQYAKRTTAGTPTDDVEVLVAEAAAAISATALLTPLFREQPVYQQLSGKLQVLTEREFNTRYTTCMVELNSNTEWPSWSAFACTPVLRLDTIAGFRHQSMMYLRDRNANTSTCVHESMHLLSSPTWKQTFGDCLNEGATEYFSQYVCMQGGVAFDKFVYQHAVGLMKLILESCEIPLQTLCQAYFGGTVEPVYTAVRRVSGYRGIAILQEQGLDHEETYKKWSEQVKAFSLTDEITDHLSDARRWFESLGK